MVINEKIIFGAIRLTNKKSGFLRATTLNVTSLNGSGQHSYLRFSTKEFIDNRRHCTFSGINERDQINADNIEVQRMNFTQDHGYFCYMAVLSSLCMGKHSPGYHKMLA